MAHHIKVETVPALNKDGSPSKTKKIHLIKHRGRKGGAQVVASTSMKKDLPRLLEEIRLGFIEDHLMNHPNDMAFRRKHGIKADA